MRPCGFCGMPEVVSEDIAVLKLWGRCKSRGALPMPGGVFDQPEWLMDAFDAIDSALERARAARVEREQLERMRGALKHG